MNVLMIPALVSLMMYCDILRIVMLRCSVEDDTFVSCACETLFLPPQDYVQAVTGLCYDGLEGLIYLVLFSFVTALMFSSIICSVPHTWQGRR